MNREGRGLALKRARTNEDGGEFADARNLKASLRNCAVNYAAVPGIAK